MYFQLFKEKVMCKFWQTVLWVILFLPFFSFLTFETGSHYVSIASLKLLHSRPSPSSWDYRQIKPICLTVGEGRRQEGRGEKGERGKGRRVCFGSSFWFFVIVVFVLSRSLTGQPKLACFNILNARNAEMHHHAWLPTFAFLKLCFSNIT